MKSKKVRTIKVAVEEESVVSVANVVVEVTGVEVDVAVATTIAVRKKTMKASSR